MEEFVPSLSRLINEFLRQPGRRPMKRHELAVALRLPSFRRSELRPALRELEKSGQLVCLRGNRWAPAATEKQVTGILRRTPSGFGFVADDADPRREIYIPADAQNGALHEDRVVVAITRSIPGHVGAEDAGLPRERGRVKSVIERRRPLISGLLLRGPGYWYVVPDDPRCAENCRLRETDGLPPGGERHLVTVRLDDWAPVRPRGLEGTLVEDLGPASARAAQLTALLRRHNLAPEFEPDLIRRAPRDARRAADADPDAARRRDLRDRLTITIDPEDAHDFDDAVSLEPRPDGGWSLGVHIADVSQYVPMDSAADREARRRGNTVYLVERAVFMLPRELTQDICSLQPDSDRMAHTAQIELDAECVIQSWETFPSRIHSRTRLDYDAVQAFIAGRPPPGLDPAVAAMLTHMNALAVRMRERRLAAGALAFNVGETRCVLGADGAVVGFKKTGGTDSYQLIEEFMLAANQCVARTLAGARRPSLYRIHDPPDEGRFGELRDTLRALGHPLRRLDNAALNELVAAADNTPLAGVLTLVILRHLKRAVYAAQRRPHFGLAFTHYTHFTSPIRRYADLIVHRLLKAHERGEPSPYSAADLAAIAAHVSDTEREADEAENESVEFHRLEYYRRKLADGDTGPWPGMVTDFVARGALVELAESGQRGLVAFADLPGGWYEVSPERVSARGQRGGHTLRIGDRMDVRLARVDDRLNRIDFAPAGPVRAPRRRAAAARRKRR